MTATTVAPPRTPPDLVRIEFVRLLRHPAFVGFAALSLLMHLIGYIERAGPNRSNLLYDTVANGTPFWVPAAAGFSIAAGFAAVRARRDDLEDLFDSAPVTRPSRSDALLGAIVGVGALSLAAVIAVTTVTGGWNGFPFLLDPGRTTWAEFPQGAELQPTDVTPSVVELASGPFALVVWGLFGVVVARTVGSRVLVIAAPLVGFIQLIIVTWTPETPTRWLWPYTHSARYVGWFELADDGTGIGVASGFNVAATAWHVAYMTAIAVLLAYVARWQKSTGAHRVWIPATALVVAVATAIAAMQVYTPDLSSP